MEKIAEIVDKEEVTTLVGGIEELFNRLPVALYRSAPDGELLTANTALANLLGFDSVPELFDGTDTVESFYVDQRQRELWLYRIS